MTYARPGKWLVDIETALSPGARVAIAAVSASVLLAGIGSVLAWRSYTERVDREQDHVSQAADDAALSLQQFFTGRRAMLEAVAGMPGMAEGDLERIRPMVEAAGIDSVGFTGGVRWIDRDEMLRESSAADLWNLPVDLSERGFVSAVLDSGQPSVGEVMLARLTEEEIVAMIAVPTRSAGSVTGVLMGSVILDEFDAQIPGLATERFQTRVVDRQGRVIMTEGRTETPYLPSNPRLLNDPSTTRGVGLMGDRDQVIGIAQVPEPGWTVVVEQSKSILLAGARGRFLVELAALLLLGLSTVGAAFLAAARMDASHRHMLLGARNLEALETLSEMLSAAPSTPDVADVVLTVFGRVFDAESVLVGLVDHDGRMLVHTIVDDLDKSGSEISDEGSPIDDHAILTEAFESTDDLVWNIAEANARFPDLNTSHAVTGLMAGRFVGRNARGAVCLLVRGPFPPRESDLELFTAMVPLLGDAFGRAAASESERMASRVFQHALLPRDTIGSEVNLQRAVRYIAAGGDAEVGGDWYDLWMIDPDHVGAVVGDVVGRGVVAAAAMGQLRSTLRATAAQAASPGHALAQMDDLTAQISGSPSATVLMASFEPRGRVFSLASAGHLPPLIAAGNIVRAMYEVRGAPIGFLNRRMTRVTMTAVLEPEETLVFYTDGLVERRGESIDEGIERLRRVFADNHRLGVEALADVLLRSCLDEDNQDDVALMILRPVTSNPAHYTGVAPIDDFASVLEGVTSWMRANRYPREARKLVLARIQEALDVVVRCTADDPIGDLVFEVTGGEAGDLDITLEYRRGTYGAAVDPVHRMILSGWRSGAMALGGPRLQISVAGAPVVESRPLPDERGPLFAQSEIGSSTESTPDISDSKACG